MAFLAHRLLLHIQQMKKTNRQGVKDLNLLNQKHLIGNMLNFMPNSAVLTCWKPKGPLAYWANLRSLLTHLPVEDNTESDIEQHRVSLLSLCVCVCVCVCACILTAILISMKESLGEPWPILSWSSEFNATRSFFSAWRRAIWPLSVSSSVCRHYGRYLTSFNSFYD